jgi:hypothetical protein
MQESYKYMRELGADFYTTALAIPFIGSEMYNDFKKFGYASANDVNNWNNSFFESRQFDTREISAEELIKFKNIVAYDVNFLGNWNLVNNNLETAIILYNDIINIYPFHIIALASLCMAHLKNNDHHSAKEAASAMKHMIATNHISKQMYDDYGYLICTVMVIT